MEKEWIDIKTREPEKDGIYLVKMSQGSMDRRIVETESHYIKIPNQRAYWSGAFDWNYVIAWKEND